jgi:heat shock protein HtpX
VKKESMNTFKTFVLMVALIVVFTLLGKVIGGPSVATFAFIMALILNFGMYWFSDRLVLAMYRAREVGEKEAPMLHRIVTELAQKANMPKPRVYIVPTIHANAFATGRNPNSACVAVTEGLLQLLNPDEIEGVLSHELAHIKNRDILISTIAATMAGAIFYLANMARWLSIFGFGSRGEDEERGGNIIGMLILSIVAPIAALLIQMAISRQREYLADSTGARITHKPMSLANALRKLAYGAKKLPLQEANPATSHMFIVKPFSGKTLINLFSTHPPIEERIKRLERIIF